MGDTIFTGQCFCRAISFSVLSLPSKSYLCHCIDCQRFSGSAFAHNASFDASSVKISVNNEARIGWKTTKTSSVVDITSNLNLIQGGDDKDSARDCMEEAQGQSLSTTRLANVLSTFGNETTGRQQFCRICGTRLFLYCKKSMVSMRNRVVIPVGVIVNSHADDRLKPTAEAWSHRKVRWMPDGPEVQKL